MDPLKIDGSHGEGGGQILRTALALSCITKRPIQIENIRHNRKVPGLRPSHLSTIKLLGKIYNAQMDGASVGSTSIRFAPGEIQDTKLVENVGTAGCFAGRGSGLEKRHPKTVFAGGITRKGANGAHCGKMEAVPKRGYVVFVAKPR